MINREQILKEVSFSFSGSSGPGGQNVNRVNTKVEIRLDITNSSVFNSEEKERLVKKLAHKLTTQHELVITSSVSRSQLKNKEDAIARLMEVLEKGLVVPKVRKKTKPTKASKMKRLQGKKNLSEKKALRKNPLL